MNIVWHGYSCFRITENQAGGEVSVVIDPFVPEGSARLPRNLAADLVVVSHDHPRHNNVEAVSATAGGAAPFVIDGPGEYEVKEIMVTGIPSSHGGDEGEDKNANTMYYLVVNGVHMVHLGDLNHKLEEKHMTEVHDIDVLFVPVGGHGTLDAKAAAEVVGQLEPRVIIPMHYKAGGVCDDCDGVDAFLKVMGMSRPEPVAKLKLAAKDLPQDEMKIVLLDPQ
jgi:L-ascorbate metabolism protein UlaG (beta-lactamase superfamily)